MEFLGLEIKRKKSEEVETQDVLSKTIGTPENDDSAIEIFGSSSPGLLSTAKEVTLQAIEINKNRSMTSSMDIDNAVSAIIDDFVNVSGDTRPVDINLSNTEFSESIQKKILEEHENVLRLLEFNKKGYDKIRSWYVDAVLYHHMIPHKDEKKGLKQINFLDPRKITKVRQIQTKQEGQRSVIAQMDEFFVYSDTFYTEKYRTGFRPVDSHGYVLSLDAVSFIHSGIMSIEDNVIKSNLHKAYKPFNQLNSVEGALVVYRLARAPERRLFYVDVGSMPKTTAEQYVLRLKERYKSKMTYDGETGIVSANANQQTMLEDFWLPRREGGKGTEVTNLQGGCLSMDTKVSLLDGRELSIVDIENEMKDGKELWTYSVDPDSGKILPGLISWAGVTNKNADVMRITLDNGECITCTPDHKFPVNDKGFVRADGLMLDESMMPLYRKNENISKNKKLDYEQVFDIETKKWVFTHRLVCDNLNEDDYSNEKKESVHNHRIVKIEYLDDKIEVGTLTIDKEHNVHDFHTFALSCGIFTKNSNLGEIEDILYFQKRLYKSLNVPLSRMDSDESGFNVGRTAEITRDELKFIRFLNRLRTRFNGLFKDVLKNQLILKRIITMEEWNENEDAIAYDYKEDFVLSEQRDMDLLSDRLDILSNISEYVGTYFSQDFVMRKVLGMSDADIEEEKEKIAKEVPLEDEEGDAEAEEGEEQEVEEKEPPKKPKPEQPAEKDAEPEPKE